MNGIAPGTTISIALIFSAIAVASQISSILSARKKDRQQEEDKSIEIQKNFVTINLKLDNLAQSVQTLIESDRKRGVELAEVRETLIRVTDRIEALAKSSDDHEKRIKQLEYEVHQRKT